MKNVVVIIAFLYCAMAHADVILPAVFSDHMVLQQNSSVTIWGWAKPNEKVSVTPSWDTAREYTVTVTNQSAWTLNIETPGAGGPYQLKVQGYNTIEIN